MDKATNGGNYGIYTPDLSMGMLSTMAWNYDNATTANAGGAFYNNVAYYLYGDAQVKQEMAGIWGALYNNIANLNNILPEIAEEEEVFCGGFYKNIANLKKILREIDEKKDVFVGDNYDRIKGQAIALRALFHFDLARLFGQSPAIAATAKAIPYVTQ